MCVLPPACASKKPPTFVTWSSSPSDDRFRPTKSGASLTTSGCRIAASISPTAIRHRLARRMPTFWSPFPPITILRAATFTSFVWRSRKQFPGVTFAFLPADMVGQILNFGLPAPIDVQIVGNDLEGNRRVADALLTQIEICPWNGRSANSATVRRALSAPQSRAHQSGGAGFSAHDIAQNLLVSLSGSFQTSPTFWVSPENHVSYQIATQTPRVSHRQFAAAGEHSDHRHRPECSSITHGQSGLHAAGHRNGGGFSLRRCTGNRHLWRCRRTRFGWCGRRHQQDH